jgi:hypothetical protein
VRRRILTKDFLMSELSAKHDHLMSLLAELDERQMLEPITSDLWSAKDILAHLTAWDKRGTNWIATAARGDMPAIPEAGVTWTGRHKLNAQTYWENQALSLDEVIRNYRQVFRKLLKTLKAMKADDWTRLTPVQHKYSIGKPIPIAELVYWRLQHLVSHGKPIERYVARTIVTKVSLKEKHHE